MKRRARVEPGHVVDWATKAAEYIHGERRTTVARTAAIIATFAEPLLVLLRDARRSHRHEEAPFEFGLAACCPECDCGMHCRSGVCDCGADAWNARVDAALAGPKASNPGRPAAPRRGRQKQG